MAGRWRGPRSRAYRWRNLCDLGFHRRERETAAVALRFGHSNGNDAGRAECPRQRSVCLLRDFARRQAPPRRARRLYAWKGTRDRRLGADRWQESQRTPQTAALRPATGQLLGPVLHARWPALDRLQPQQERKGPNEGVLDYRLGRKHWQTFAPIHQRRADDAG